MLHLFLFCLGHRTSLMLSELKALVDRWEKDQGMLKHSSSNKQSCISATTASPPIVTQSETQVAYFVRVKWMK